MEIIHLVLGKANPQRMNGVNKVVHQLATEQSAAGRGVQVWGIAGDTNHNYGPRNYTTRLFQAPTLPFCMPAGLRQALKRVRGNAIFHVHGGWVPAFWTVTRALQNLGIPYVFTPHGAYNVEAMRRSALRKAVYLPLFERKVLAGAMQVHCIGASELRGLQQLVPGRSGVLTPYGYTRSASTQWVHPQQNGRFVVGFMGRIDIHTKGLDLLLAAMEAVHAAQPDVELWVMGDGQDSVRLRQLVAAAGLQDTVRLLGPHYGTDKEQLLAQMSVFVHPSRNEGLPSGVLEAASLGLPCVVSEATNMGSYVRQWQAGEVVGDGDAQALARALLRLHGRWLEGSLDRIGRNAQHMVERAFAWRKLVPEFDKLYLVP